MANWAFYSTIFVCLLDFVIEQRELDVTSALQLHKMLQVFTEERYRLAKYLRMFDVLAINPRSMSDHAADFQLLASQPLFHQVQPVFTTENQSKAQKIIAQLKNLIARQQSSGGAQPQVMDFAFFDDSAPRQLAVVETLIDACMRLARLFDIDNSKLFVDLVSDRRGVPTFGAAVDPEILLAPETIGLRLTETGKKQVMFGERKCTKRDIRYMGDNMYRPVSSMENEFLVKLAVELTERLQLSFSLRPLASYVVLFWIGISITFLFIIVSIARLLLSR